MTTTAHEHARAERVGMTDLAKAEHRRRIAEIQWLKAQAKAKVAEIEAEIEKPTVTPRETAGKKLAIAEIVFETAQLQNEQAILKIELVEDKELFPR